MLHKLSHNSVEGLYQSSLYHSNFHSMCCQGKHSATDFAINPVTRSSADFTCHSSIWFFSVIITANIFLENINRLNNTSL